MMQAFHTLLMALLMLAACSGALAKNVGLMIGIAEYADPKVPPLAGPLHDIAALKARLEQHWQFRQADMRVLVNREATRERILAEIEALESRSARGDTVLIYFSGHGTSAGDQDNAYDLPYATGAWIPADFRSTGVPSIGDRLVVGRRDLLPRLKRLDDGGRFVFVLTDSCYSGQLVRNARRKEGTPRMVNLGPPGRTAPAVRIAPPPYPYKNVLMLSAASDSEAALDLPAAGDWATVDGKPHGAFTDSVLRLLDGEILKAQRFSFAQAYHAISRFMGRRGYGHEPQLLPALSEDNSDIGARPFLRAFEPAQLFAARATADDAGPAALRVKVGEGLKRLAERISRLPGVVLAAKDYDMSVQAGRTSPAERGGQPSKEQRTLAVAARGNSAELTSAAGDPVLTVDADDAVLLHRISSEAWLRGALSRAARSFGMRTELNPSSRGGTFLQCEKFNIQVKVAVPAHVAIINLNPRGRLSVLYPIGRDKPLALEAGKVHAIPGSSPRDQIVVTPPFGTDLMAVLALPGPPDFLPRGEADMPLVPDSAEARAFMDALDALKGNFEAAFLPVRTYPGSGTGGKLCG